MDIDIVSDLNDNDDVIEGTVLAHGDAQPAHADPKPASTPAAAPKADAPAKPLSLRDQISSALKSETDTPPAALQDGRARNPDGTFAPKAADTAPNGDPLIIDPNAPPAAPVTAAPAGIDPQVFASLPAETQATLARTMEEVATSQQRFASLAPIEQLIAPRVDAWALNGMQPAQALHQLLALSDFATRDTAGFIQYIAQHNGIDLEELVLGMEPDEPVDPTVKALQDRIAQLEGVTGGFTQQQQQAAHNATVDQVVAFASEKGQDNQPLRPYFSELGEAVMPYISMVKQQNPSWSHTQVLQEAYDRACWATPSVRSKMQQAAATAQDAERLRAEAARVEKARTASVSVRTGAPSSPPAAPNDPSRSLRDTIRASMTAAN